MLWKASTVFLCIGEIKDLACRSLETLVSGTGRGFLVRATVQEGGGLRDFCGCKVRVGPE